MDEIQLEDYLSEKDEDLNIALFQIDLDCPYKLNREEWNSLLEDKLEETLNLIEDEYYKIRIEKVADHMEGILTKRLVLRFYKDPTKEELDKKIIGKYISFYLKDKLEDIVDKCSNQEEVENINELKNQAEAVKNNIKSLQLRKYAFHPDWRHSFSKDYQIIMNSFTKFLGMLDLKDEEEELDSEREKEITQVNIKEVFEELIENPSFETMEIYSEPGTKVIYTGKNGYDHDRERADKLLEVGKTYTVLETDVQPWSTGVSLEEVPNEWFNSVHFMEEEYLIEQTKIRNNGKGY